MTKKRKPVKRWKSVSDFTSAGVSLTDEQKNFIEQQDPYFWVGGDTADEALKKLNYKIEHPEETAKKAEKKKRKSVIEMLSEQRDSEMKETLKPITEDIKKVMAEKGESWQYISRLIVELLNEETNNKIKEAEKQLEKLKQNLIK